MKMKYHPPITLILLIVLSACGGGSSSSSSSSSTGSTAVGSIAGTISISNLFLPASLTSASATTNSQAVAANSQNLSQGGDPQEFVSGEIIIGFKSSVNPASALADLLKRYADVHLTDTGTLYPNGPYLLRTSAYNNPSSSPTAAKEATRGVVQRLRGEAAAEYVEFNGIRHAQVMPNDTAFAAGLQWNLNMINLPAAWEITTGSSQVVVAVLDTGIRSHSDLDTNVLSTGYDFVDGDTDPTEPLTPMASFHGTHVAGTIASVGNNNSGIAGVAWGVKILPVRVLGSLGAGTDASILNGMLYAAGLSNSSGTVPPQHANVINMSLASLQSCPTSYQNVINQVIAAGVVVVAAAGNDGESTNPATPASCQGVISVAAIDPFASLASYSDYQSYVTIAAPGGQIEEGIHDAILSTLPVSGTGQPFYRFEHGTSMAAPHVAGVVALMLSANPTLTPSQVKTILTSNAASFITARNTDQGTQTSVTVPFGMVDAGAAVASATGQSPSAAVPYPFPAAASFGQISIPMQLPVTLFNTGGSALSISGLGCSTDGQTSYDCTVGHSWLYVTTDGTCGSIAVSSSCAVMVTVDPTGLSSGQQYVGFMSLATNGGNLTVPVFFQVGQLPTPSSIGPLSVQLWAISSQTGELTQKVSEASVTSVPATGAASFLFSSVPVGEYVVVAGVDKNGDGVFGDASGETQIISPDPVSGIAVSADQTTNIDLQVRNEPDDIANGF